MSRQPAHQTEPLLKIEGIAKRYGSFQALSGVSFDMRAGEIISVLGPSGCGKSTLLQLVAGLARPDEGEIRMNGGTIASRHTMVPPEKRGVNMVFQDYALWPHMSVFDNIAYGLSKLRSGEKRSRVASLLEMLHLEGLENRLPPQLSGGQQQRVAIARALATEPKLLLLDEPLSNLDMRLRVEMRTEMAYLFRKLGTSVFHVTHDPEEAFAMADRLLILRNGAIDQIGTPQQCFSRPASRWAASLLGAINRLSGRIVRTPRGAALRIGDRLIEGIASAETAQLPDGAEADLLFRPEDWSIVGSGQPFGLDAEIAAAQTAAAAESPGPEGAARASADNRFEVRVLHSTFEGNRWRSVVACGPEQHQAHKLYLLGQRPLEPNTRLTVSLPVHCSFLYAAP